jgi:lipid-A-disaccharide synthase
MARSCDRVLCLLPFEPAFYSGHGLQAEFVGHPLADEIPLPAERAAARRELGIDAQATVVALLPGSRRGEVQRLAPDFLRAASELAAARSDLLWLAPMASAAAREQFEAAGVRPPGLRILEGRARLALQAADVALVASGTATLESLLCGCPLVVAYRFGALTAFLLRALRLVRLPYFSLPNLLAGEHLVAEFFQSEVRGPALARALAALLDDDAARARLRERFAAIHVALRQGGAVKAARSVLELARSPAQAP